MSDHDAPDDTGHRDSDDVESLLGAYVLDAVDDVERRRVDRLLETSPEARAEVARLDAAADQVAEALASGASAPPALLGSIMAGIAERPRASTGADDAPVEPATVEPAAPSPATSPDAPNPAGGSSSGVISLDEQRSARRSRAPWILSAAAVVLLVVVGALAISRGDDGGGATDTVAAMQQMAADAATMPGARTGALTDPDNTMAVQVVVDPAGRAFVMSDALPALDDEHTYQLWSVDGGTPVSIGLLGSDPEMSLIGVDGAVHTLAITAEPVGGSAGPTTQPMASGTLTLI